MTTSGIDRPEGRLFEYVGPSDVRSRALSQPPTAVRVDAVLNLRAELARASIEVDPTWVVLSFIVDRDGALVVGDRRVEHVGLARGAPVRAAGEITLDLTEEPAAVLAVTNQSTGYCPAPGSWPAVETALAAAGLKAPRDYTTAYVFAVCPECGQVSILKEDRADCEVCGSAYDHR